MPAPPIVSWRLPVATQTQLCLCHISLPCPTTAASACVKSNCSADKRMHMVSTGSSTLATGNWRRRHLRRHVGATKSYGKYDKLGANFIYAPDSRVEAEPQSPESPSRVSKPSLYSCNAPCIFWPCNLKPFLPQRNKVVSCCFARNENANDGNHDQAVGQQKATLCSSLLLLLLLFLGKLDYRALSLVAEKFLEFQCHFYRCEARSFYIYPVNVEILKRVCCECTKRVSGY